MSVYLLANLVTVMASGILIGIIAKAVRLTTEAQWRQLEEFVAGVHRGEPGAKQRFERIAHLYWLVARARVRISAPSEQPAHHDSGGRRAGSFSMSVWVAGGTISVERTVPGKRMRLVIIAVLFIVQLLLGLPTTLVLFAMVGLIVVLLASLLLSPLGFNLADPVLLVATALEAYRVVSRLQERAERSSQGPHASRP